MNGEKPDTKHPCPDCTFCRWCSDDRCSLCRVEKCAGKRKLSLEEQVALYESLNGNGKERCPICRSDPAGA